MRRRVLLGDGMDKTVLLRNFNAALRDEQLRALTK